MPADLFSFFPFSFFSLLPMRAGVVGWIHLIFFATRRRSLALSDCVMSSSSSSSFSFAGCCCCCWLSVGRKKRGVSNRFSLLLDSPIFWWGGKRKKSCGPPRRKLSGFFLSSVHRLCCWLFLIAALRFFFWVVVVVDGPFSISRCVWWWCTGWTEETGRDGRQPPTTKTLIIRHRRLSRIVWFAAGGDALLLKLLSCFSTVWPDKCKLAP